MAVARTHRLTGPSIHPLLCNQINTLSTSRVITILRTPSMATSVPHVFGIVAPRRERRFHAKEYDTASDPSTRTRWQMHMHRSFQGNEVCRWCACNQDGSSNFYTVERTKHATRVACPRGWSHRAVLSGGWKRTDRPPRSPMPMRRLASVRKGRNMLCYQVAINSKDYFDTYQL
jgi:hypothetical protein